MKKTLLAHWFIGLASLLPAYLDANTYTFTSAEATGREGPNQAQVDANYTGTSLDGAVTINTQGIQEWIVPEDGNYSIEAWGAKGGPGKNQSDTNSNGGKGAYMSGTFSLTSGYALKILIGQKGLDSGGGGGTYVVSATNSALLIAGGGASPGSGGGTGGTLDAVTDNNPVNGGTDGSGGSSISNHGAGGGGLLSNGQDGAYGTGGFAFVNNGTGGDGTDSHNSDGGFGGGGSGSNGFSGGGGGYSGGSGKNGSFSHGGGSYNSGTQQTNTAGASEGHGKVIIIFYSSSSNQSQSPLITQGAGPLAKTIDEDNNATWTTSELNATDPDTEASSLAWSLLASPSNGTAIVSGNGSAPTTLSYQPNADYHGSDSFSVQVSDGDNNDSITINLTINPVDDSTSVSGDSNASIAEDSSASGDLNATDADGMTDGSYFSISTAPANGSASIDPVDGNWTYSPNLNFFGSDSYVVSITDDLNTSTTISINLSVSVVDDATSISGDTNASIAEDSTASGDLNATDADGLTDGSYFSISAAPSNGSATIDPIDGNWTYSPNPNYFGSDSFVVSITDDLNTSTTSTISLSVYSVDDTTSISGDSNASIAEDSTASGDLNATDADGLTDGSYFSISTAPSNGSATIDPIDGNWTYSPNPNYFGSDFFVVSITDDLNTSTTSTISLSVSSVDDATSITGDTSASIAEDIVAYGELNATDVDGLTDGSYFSISTAPANGSASIDPVDGNWTYSPNPNFFGPDSFVVSVTDDLNTPSTITINLSISAVDDTTSITGDTNASIAEDGVAYGDLNATDVDGLTDGSYFSISTAPTNGSASIDPLDGNWTYSPNLNFFGPDSFVVSVTDDLITSTSFTISLSVSSVDDATSISADTNASIAEDSSAFGDLNATDADGLSDGSYFSIFTAPANGSASIDPADGNWTYSPNPNFFGSDSFVVSVTDDLNTSTTLTINLSVSSVDDTTIIVGDTNTSITEDGVAYGDLNATDADGLTDGSYFSISTAPANGSASIDPVDGNWTYSPTPNFFGFDSFVVSITDDLNTSTTTSINLSIFAVDDATSISGDTQASIAEDSSASGDLNATDDDGLTDGSYFSISTAPSNGSATIDPVDGNWTYSPTPNFFGSDSFVVSVTDDLNTSSTTTISLSVYSVDDATILSGDTNSSIAEDTYASGDLNVTDADGLTDGSYFSISTVPSNGSATIDPVDGNWTYFPNPHFFGSDSFVVSVTDDLNSTTTTTISVSVSSVDDATIQSGDSNASIAEDSFASGDLNATDADGLTDGSYFSISTAPSNGSASIDPVDGNWTYSPNPNFFGSDSFVVSVTDDLNTSTTTTINLSIFAVDDATSISGDTQASIAEDSSASGDLNATDDDGLTDGSYFSISTAPSNGSATIDPVSGNWTYTPNIDFFGSDSFVVSVTDDLNISSSTIISLTITEVAEPDSDYSSPYNSTSSPDDQYSTPVDSSSSQDTGYQSPTETYSSPDSNYSTPDDSTSSPDGAYATPDDSVTSPDEVYSTPSGETASPDTGYLSPTESYSTPDSNYTTPDDSISSPDSAYATPDDSVTSPDEVYTTPSGETASPDTGYQSPTVTYSSQDSNYSSPDDSTSSSDDDYSTPDDLVTSPDEVYTTPDDSISSPDGSYSTPDDSLSSPEEVYTSPSGDTASPDTGYESPTESYSSPDSNYTTPDDSISSPDGSYTTPDDSVSSPDDQYASPVYHLPVVETAQPSIYATGSITLYGSVHSDGGSTLLEVGFLLSSTLDFNQSERFVTELDSTTGEFLLQTSNDSAQFVRAFASNAVGESLGQVVAFESPSSESSVWADAQSLPGGWLQSDWLGTFQPYGNGWIFHTRLGWLYVPSSDDEGLWMWSSTEEWIWTQRGIAPHFFDHGSSDWLYLLPAGEHGKTFYDYSIENVR